MTLWLDDLRPPGRHGHIGAKWVKSAQEAIDYLKEHREHVTFISLDHDLRNDHYPFHIDKYGNEVQREELPVLGEGTGYDVAAWLAEQNWWPERGINLHSLNRDGVKRMYHALHRAWVSQGCPGGPLTLAKAIT